MTHLKRILLAIRALPVLAARLIVNLLPVLAVVGFAAALGACGGKMGDDDRAATLFVPLFVGAAIIGGSGGNSDNAPATMTETPAPPTMTMTNPAPTMTMTMTVTMPEPMEPAPMPMPEPMEPAGPSLTSPEYGLLGFLDFSERRWLVALSLTAQMQNTVLFGRNVILQRQDGNWLAANVSVYAFNRTVFHESGDLVPLVEGGATVSLNPNSYQIAFQGIPTITAAAQLCQVSWMATWINARANFSCAGVSQLSYSPDMRQVIYAAMADGFNRGVGIGESPFAFSGRYDGDNRAAGFTYDWGGGYALRTDYIRLPSRQDSEVWLDTYRFGALSRINDEVQFFAGMDNYKNAIFVMDTNGNNGNNLHRLGFAYGDGYAIKYEYRLNL